MAPDPLCRSTSEITKSSLPNHADNGSAHRGFGQPRDLRSLFSAGKSECSALVRPGERNPSKQQADGHSAGLAAFGNGHDDIRGEIGKPQKPADMRIAQTEASCNLGGVGVFAMS